MHSTIRFGAFELPAGGVAGDVMKMWMVGFISEWRHPAKPAFAWCHDVVAAHCGGRFEIHHERDWRPGAAMETIPTVAKGHFWSLVVVVVFAICGEHRLFWSRLKS